MADRSPTGPGADRALNALAGLLERLPSSRPSLAVLTYHRVGPVAARPDLHPGLCVEPVAFARQMALVAAKAKPVGLDEIQAAAAGDTTLPRGAVHVTFDDAYRDVEDHAWPVMRDLGIPATMFVPTDYPDQERMFWWDRLSNALRRCPAPYLVAEGHRFTLGSDLERKTAFTQLRVEVAERPHADAMTLVDTVVEAAEALGAPAAAPATSSWAGLRTMADEGLALAAHSQCHPFLNRLPQASLAGEIGGSLAALRDAVGDAARPAFAYPSGAHDPAVVAATADAGVELGFATDRGVVDLRAPDWLRIPRINVGGRTSAPLVRIQLSSTPHRVRSLARRARSRPRSIHRPNTRSTSWN